MPDKALGPDHHRRVEQPFPVPLTEPTDHVSISCFRDPCPGLDCGAGHGFGDGCEEFGVDGVSRHDQLGQHDQVCPLVEHPVQDLLTSPAVGFDRVGLPRDLGEADPDRAVHASRS